MYEMLFEGGYNTNAYSREIHWYAETRIKINQLILGDIWNVKWLTDIYPLLFYVPLI